MRARTGILFLFFLLGVSCSKDRDSETEEAIKKENITFQAVGVDGQAIYQYNYDGPSDTGETINLSTELGLGAQYLTLRQLGKTLSFYSFSQGKFSLVQKDFTSGAVAQYIDFYTNTSARSVVWGINNEESVFFGYYSPQGSTNLAIQNIALDDFQGGDLPLEFNIEQLYQPLYYDGKLFITYRNSSLDYKISVYDTDTYALIQTINYGSISPSILIDDNGNLAVFKFTDGSTVGFERRDLTTLTVFEELEFNLNQRFPAGPLNAQIKEGTLYYEYEYSQPSNLSSGPALLDIASGENRILDLARIINEIELAEQLNINIVWQQFYAKEEVFLVSYSIANEDAILQGGVLVLSTEGMLLQQIELPFVPTYFVN